MVRGSRPVCPLFAQRAQPPVSCSRPTASSSPATVPYIIFYHFATISLSSPSPPAPPASSNPKGIQNPVGVAAEVHTQQPQMAPPNKETVERLEKQDRGYARPDVLHALFTSLGDEAEALRLLRKQGGGAAELELAPTQATAAGS